MKYSKEGNTNLESLGKANNFTDWMFGEIEPYLKGTILEIGSGIGTYSEKIVKHNDFHKVILSDIDDAYVRLLAKRYKQEGVSCLKLDLTRKEDLEKLPPVDSAFALNVLEHIESDVDALNNVYERLERGGRFIILVPAHNFLFNRIDIAVGHHRRYTKTGLRWAISQTNFKLVRMWYFNMPGIIGWYLNGNILKRSEIDESAMGFYNKIIPYVKVVEKRILFNFTGLSLIAVLEKVD